MARPLALAVPLLLALVRCGPGSPAGGGDGGRGAGGPPGGSAGGPPGGAAQVGVDLEHGAAADPAVAALDLRVVRIGFFFERAGAPPAADARCDDGDAVVDVDAGVRLDLQRDERTPLGTAEIGDDRPVGELRLFVAGARVERRGREHEARGATCLGADGAPVAVIVVHPEAAMRFQHGEEVRVVVRFDPRGQLAEDHVTCRADDHGGDGGGGGGDDGGSGGDGSGGMGGMHGGSRGSGLAGAAGLDRGGGNGGGDDAPECREQDDDDDDGNPATRLRFFLPAELSCRGEGG